MVQHPAPTGTARLCPTGGVRGAALPSPGGPLCAGTQLTESPEIPGRFTRLKFLGQGLRAPTRSDQGDQLLAKLVGTISSCHRETFRPKWSRLHETGSTPLAEFIDDFYNPLGRHRHLSALSPDHFEAAKSQPKKSLP